MVNNFDQYSSTDNAIGRATSGDPSGGVSPDWLAVGRGLPDATIQKSSGELSTSHPLWFLAAAIAFLAVSLLML